MQSQMSHHITASVYAFYSHEPKPTADAAARIIAVRYLLRDVVMCLELAGADDTDPLEMLAESKEFVIGGLTTV